MLKLMYITNDPTVAKIAADAGVDRIFIDMEVLGKAERQGGMDTVQSYHVPEDIAKVRAAVGGGTEIMARVNPLNPNSQAEIDASVENGADVIMLPMWHTADDLRRLVSMVDGRAKVMPLLETDTAADTLPEALSIPGIDQMHIGLNDLHLCYHQKFMFQLLTDGTVDRLCAELREASIPYGFGGVGRPGSGTLPAEYIIGEHYRLGSQYVILSRSFCNTEKTTDLDEIRRIFAEGVADIRRVERDCAAWTQKRFDENHRRVLRGKNRERNERMNVLVTGAFQLNSGEREQLEAAGHKVFVHGDERAPVDSPERYEAVVCNGLFLYNSIERFTSLRLIQLTSAGLDRVPLDDIWARGIALHNAAGVYSVPMAEFAVCGILQLYKQSRFFAANQAQHKWEKHRGLLELSGKRVCILGCGDVGREIAKRLKAFGCHITGVNRTVRELPDFDELLPLDKLADAAAACDILVCCIALTPETRGIVSEEIFGRLHDGAIFVNVARGALADEAALTKWLQNGGCAVLDVFAEEPLPESSPLWDMENVLLTPHNSFVGEGNRARLWETIKENLG